MVRSTARLLLLLLTAACAPADPSGSRRAAEAAPARDVVRLKPDGHSDSLRAAGTLRLLHWNVHHGVGTDSRYDLDRIATWIAKLDPHVVTLNEVERHTRRGDEDQPARYAALLEQKTRRDWWYVFARERGDREANGQGHAILSSLPFAATSRHTIAHTRTVARTTVTWHGRAITVFTTHWDYERNHVAERAAQAREMLAVAAAFAEPRIITGDLNALPDEPAIAVMAATYDDAWAIGRREGIAWSFPGNDEGYTRNRRIDYVFLSKGAAGLGLKEVFVPDTRDEGGHMPSDHRPLVVALEPRR